MGRSASWIKNQEIFRERTHRKTEDVKLFPGKKARGFKNLGKFGNTERYIGIETSFLVCLILPVPYRSDPWLSSS